MSDNLKTDMDTLFHATDDGEEQNHIAKIYATADFVVREWTAVHGPVCCPEMFEVLRETFRKCLLVLAGLSVTDDAMLNDALLNSLADVECGV
jgi:hypothetical protein